ncbi:MAG: hypothetical protein ACE5FS_09095 [Paracoccaceae bacterium]
MFRTLTASVLVAAVALAGVSATPARANDDLAKILAGAAAIFIIGKAIESSNDNNRRRKATVSSRAATATHRCERKYFRNGRWHSYYDRRCLARYDRQRGYDRDRWHDRYRDHDRRFAKPRVCLRQRWTRNGWVTYYDKPCLERFSRQHRHHVRN